MTNKRANGEGTITKRSDGRWEARVTIALDGAGRPQRKAVYGRTRADAHEKMTAILRSLQSGGLVNLDERLTTGAYLQRWLEESVRQRVRPRTFELYELIVRLHIAPIVGRVQLTKLSPMHVQRMLNKLSPTLAPRTVRTVRSVLRQALQQAVRWSLVSQNVASLVDVPRLPQSTMQPWSLAEARAFLTDIRGDRLEALYATAMLTGMRRGEVLALRWEDLDLQNQTLRVSGNLQRVNGALTRAEPKTQQSRRSVVLPSLAADLLQQHRIAQLEERLHAGSMWSDTGYVFATHIGTPIEPRNLVRQFSTLIARTGARRQRFHDLRHCFASLQLAEGTQARVVMEQLGHTQISTTLGIYSHVTQQLHRDSADRLGALFAG